jgi:hypothetical protein
LLSLDEEWDFQIPLSLRRSGTFFEEENKKYSSMAAAAHQALMRPAHKVLGSNVPDALHRVIHGGERNQSENGASEGRDSDTATAPKHDSIPVNHNPQQVLSPSEIAKDPNEKDLGMSSKDLSVKDFKLYKTLGTGMQLCLFALEFVCPVWLIHNLTGTFARVWLVSPSNDTSKDENKTVYALKVLRKVDVIRLKQVEHVRNERASLSAIAGHPFITKLICTFADRESVYMLVSLSCIFKIFQTYRIIIQVVDLLRNEANFVFVSLITVQEGKFLLIFVVHAASMSQLLGSMRLKLS